MKVMPNQDAQPVRRHGRNWVAFGTIAGAAAGVVTGVAVYSWVLLVDPLQKTDFADWLIAALVNGTVLGCLGGGFIGLAIGSVLQVLKRNPAS
jgi:hypothetical protein